jgi:2-amino-4-hydroxy-6-hydroxymethyldihydropteridine diphosphokinase
MSWCLVGLGSNLADRAETLERAIAHLRATNEVRVAACSRWHATPPVGGPAGQGEFLNGAALLETSLDPLALLAALRQIEQTAGRVRRERWGPRTLDLDLLLYGDLTLDSPELVLPHPRFAVRKFALQPATEVAPEMPHPTIGWTIRQILDHLENSAAYVAITGPIAAGKSRLAGELAAGTQARLIAEQVDDARLTEFYANPPGTAWKTELEFLDARVRLLDRATWEQGDRLAASDFHFAQSLAFASVWLDGERLAELKRRWTDAAARVQSPRFSIVLEAAEEMLLERIASRGRPYEQAIDRRWLEQLQAAMRSRELMPIAGPVLRLSAGDLQAALNEALAAVASSG